MSLDRFPDADEEDKGSACASVGIKESVIMVIIRRAVKRRLKDALNRVILRGFSIFGSKA